MRIGFDLDNTIVCYDELFHGCAVQQGLIPVSLPKSKNQIRDHIRAHFSADAWTELQGLVYGPRMKDAPVFPGCLEFLTACRDTGAAMFIVSHRTRYPVLGPRHDLHEAARECLWGHGIIGSAYSLMSEDAVFFADSRKKKIARIRSLGLTDFVDDLQKVLADPEFPVETNRFWFHPRDDPDPGSGARVVQSWCELKQLIFGDS